MQNQRCLNEDYLVLSNAACIIFVARRIMPFVIRHVSNPASRTLMSLCVHKHLLVQIVWNLSSKVHGEVDDLLRPERLEVWLWTAKC